jgi:hypothetical protein
MKTIVNIILWPIFLLAACQSKSSKVQHFIDGIYVNHARGDMSIADDTLTFTHTGANHYLVTRRTGYRAIRNGKPLKKKYHEEKLEGTYDPANRVLNETTTGRVFRFDPDKGVLLLKVSLQKIVNSLN